MLTNSAILRVTGLLLIDNEIGQSILRDIRPSFALSQFTYSCVTLFRYRT